jgi:hypothetical protein
VERERWTHRLAVAGHLVGVSSIVWGLLSGDLRLLLAGLIIAAIVLVTSE